MNRRTGIAIFIFLIVISTLGYLTILNSPVSKTENRITEQRDDIVAEKPGEENLEATKNFPLDVSDSDTPMDPEILLNVNIACPESPHISPVQLTVWKEEKEFLTKTLFPSGRNRYKHIFHSLPIPGIYTVIASASGLVPSKEIVTLDDRTVTLSLSLFPKPIVNLRCVDQGGDVVPGTQIDIHSNTQGVYATTLQSDEKGELQFELPYPGDYTITLSHPRYPKITHENIHVEGNPNRYTFVLSSRSGMIVGKVLDEFLNPLSQMKVYLYRFSNHNRIAEVETNPEGVFVFHDLSLTDYFVNVDGGENYLNRDITYHEQTREDTLFLPIMLTPENPTQEVNFSLSRAVIIRGKVVDSTNQPIPGVTIKAGIQANRRQSVFPLDREIRSDEEGMFTYPVSTRIRSRNNLLLSAVHPDYGYMQHRIENYGERNEEEISTLVLEKNLGVFKGTAVERTTREPVPSLSVELIPNQFRNETVFRKLASTDEYGNVQTTLAEGQYLLEIKGYSIFSPKIITINQGRETTKTIFVEKDEEETITIKGLVITADQTPIHGARIFLQTDDRFFGNSESTPKGTFEMKIKESAFSFQPTLRIYHKLYQEWNTPLLELADYEGVLAELSPHQGSIKVILNGINHSDPVRVLLMTPQSYDAFYTVETAYESSIFLPNIDEQRGPFYLLACSKNALGISPLFDLRNTPSRFFEIIIGMNNQNAMSTLAIQVLDSEEETPLPVALCEINAVTVNLYGSPTQYKIRKITSEDGFVTISNIPICIGSLTISRPAYESQTIPFLNHGSILPPFIIHLKKQE